MTVPEPSDVVDQDRASAVFAKFAAADDLAWRFPADGCYARTGFGRQMAERAPRYAENGANGSRGTAIARAGWNGLLARSGSA